MDCKNINHDRAYNLGRFLGNAKSIPGVRNQTAKSFRALADEIEQHTADHKAGLGCDQDPLAKQDLPACPKCGSRDHSAAFCKKDNANTGGAP